MADHKEYITCIEDQGTVNISEDVISAIAAAAVAEVDGVAGFASSFGLGKKGQSKGMKISIDGDSLQVDAFILLKYGAVISDEAKSVQKVISSGIEAMTGITPAAVNVHICGITFEKSGK